MGFPPRTFLTLLAIVLGGCAGYRPQPLPKSPDLETHHENPAMNMTEAAAWAVRQNPDLKTERAKDGIAAATAYNAGLLPDPQLNATFSQITTNAPGFIDGYDVGFSYDIRALFLHGPTVNAAQASLRGARQDLLWQEWQTIQKARTLYVQKFIAAEKIAILKDT